MDISVLLSMGQIKFSVNKYTDYFNLLGSLLFKLLLVTYLNRQKKYFSDIEKENVMGPWR